MLGGSVTIPGNTCPSGPLCILFPLLCMGHRSGVIRCGLSSNWSVGLETSANAEGKSILSDACVVENTDVKVI